MMYVFSVRFKGTPGQCKKSPVMCVLTLESVNTLKNDYVVYFFIVIITEVKCLFCVVTRIY